MEMTDDLLITYLLKEAAPDEARLVDEWLKQSEANRQRFDQFSLVWETSRRLGGSYPLDPQESLKNLRQKAKHLQTERPKTVKLYQATWFRVAAMLFVLGGGSWLLYKSISGRQLQFNTAETVKADTLSDGSVITLNKHSRLLYPYRFTGDQRKVELMGEAFFKVAPDKAKPFIISTNGTLIRVVGTSFNVKNKNDRVEVIVETGIVQVSKNDRTITLGPDEKVLVGADESLIKEKNSDQLYNYYRSMKFEANNTPLWRMVEVLNEVYNSHIVIGRKDLYNLPLNTTFNNESLDNILQIIGRTFKITVENNGNQIILK